jgi:hypothetical protein
MRRVPRLTAGIKSPARIDCYLDLCRVWRPRPFVKAEVDWLKDRCGSVHFGRKRNGRFNLHRLIVGQPTRAARRWLAAQPGLQLSYVELALDWVFDSQREYDAAYALVDRCFYQKYHRVSHHVHHEKRTRYSGPRKLRHVVVLYDDLPSRNTGEVYTVHVEWRTRGADALRRIKIDSIADLIDFDHLDFWRTHLLLWEVDRDLLLQMFMNNANDNRRRDGAMLQGAWFSREQIARRLFGLYRDTQSIVDCLRRIVHVERAVIPLDVEHLLPLPNDVCEQSHHYEQAPRKPRGIPGGPICGKATIMPARNARERLKELILADAAVSDRELAQRLAAEGCALPDFVIAAVAADFRHTLRLLRCCRCLPPDFVIKQPRQGNTDRREQGPRVPDP